MRRPLLTSLLVVPLLAAGVVSGCSSDDSAAGSNGPAVGAGGASAAGGSAGNAGNSGSAGSAANAGAAGSGGGAIGGSSGSSGTAGTSSGPCTSTTDCKASEVCAGGQCLPTHGGCTDDGDCEGDTYCCNGNVAHPGDPPCLPSGETTGGCISFGTGPQGNFNDECVSNVVIGLFEASKQCEWLAPPSGDAYPEHTNVLATPLVANLPNDSGAASEIIIVSYNYTDGGSESGYGSNPAYYGVIRILNGQTCEQLETVDGGEGNRIIAASPPAIGDLDGDGIPEIVTHREHTGVIAFKWNATSGHYENYWVSTDSQIADQTRWDGPSLHDLDDDGFPEVISGGEVFDGKTGARKNPGQVVPGAGAMIIPVLGDLDGDGKVEMIVGPVYRWNTTGATWEQVYTGAATLQHYGFADFGTPSGGTFDPKHLDGIAEVVSVGNGTVEIATLSGQIVLQTTIPTPGGGPPTIGDFDGDGFPEVATAGGTAYVIVDLDCAPDANSMVPAGCVQPYVRWTMPSQDSSSQNTGSAIFDFEGDGKAEAVYADECFTRIYDGTTGDVLYSATRTSCTWYENPVIADPDRDSNTEILVGSNANCGVACPELDPIHKGVRCDTANNGADCASGVCDTGFCRCTEDAQCGSDDYHCAAPLAGTPGGGGNTCRAYHPVGVGQSGVRVLRDRLDRWASSRPLWNQHAYSITNVNDDGTIPKTSAWMQNFKQAGLNNYRQNAQGTTSSEDIPDITGKLDASSACQIQGEKITLNATVCNRGHRAVGAALPATFYQGNPADNVILCTSYTSGPVPIGECLAVSCTISQQATGKVTMVVNDDGAGGQTTVECVYDNNTDAVDITDCSIIQ